VLEGTKLVFAGVASSINIAVCKIILMILHYPALVVGKIASFEIYSTALQYFSSFTIRSVETSRNRLSGFNKHHI